MRWLRLLAWTAGGIVALMFVLFAGLQTTAGQRTLASLATSLASSKDRQIEIAGLDGFFPTDFRVARVTIADRQGVWLSVDDAKLTWSFASLFTGRVRVNEIVARRVEVVRAPISEEKKTETAPSSGFNLPVGVDVRKLDIPDIHVGEQLAAGIDLHWKLAGAVLLAADGSQSKLDFTLDRTDGPSARIASDLTFDIGTRTAKGQFTIEEPNRGGMVATLAGIPEIDRVFVRVDAREGAALGFDVDAQAHALHASLKSTGTYDLASDKLEAGARFEMGGGVDWRDLKLDLQAKLGGLRTQPSGTATVTGSAEDVRYATLGPMHVDLAAKLNMLRDGRIAVENLDVSSPIATVKGTGSYRTATQDGEAKLAVDGSNLAAFSQLAGVPLEGRTHVDLTLNTNRDGMRVGWQGTVDDLAVQGVPKSLATPSLKLSGRGGYKKDGNWQLDRAQVATDRATFDVNGKGAGNAGELALSVTLPDLATLQPGITGSGTVKSTLAYSADDAHGKVNIDGMVMDQPLKLAADFTRKMDGSLSLPTIQGSWASASVDVHDLTVTPQGTTGSGQLRMTKLEDLSPILGTPIAGELNIDIATDPDPLGKIKVAVRGERLSGQGVGVATLQLDGTVSDPLGKADTEATLKVLGLSGVQGLSQVNATAKGDKENIGIDLTAAGAGMNGALAAKVEAAGEEVQVGLQRFTGRYQGIPIALAAPARIKVAGPRTTIENAAFSVGAGKVAIAGALDNGMSDLTIQIAQLPLALAETFVPGTKLDGSLQAKAHVTGPLAQPRVQATYAIAGLRVKRPQTALVPAVAIQGNATVAGQQATYDATVAAGGATRLSLKGDATLPQGRSALRAKVSVQGSMDIAPFATVLGNDIRGIAGTVRPDLTVNVNGESISGNGTVAFTGGALYLPEMGLRLTNGQGTMALQGDTLQIQRLSFQTARNGEISASGTVKLDKDMPTNIAVTTRKALLVNRPDLAATVSSDVKVTGSQTAGLEAQGTITIDRAEIAVGASQAAKYPVLPVREINGTSPSAPLVPQAQPKKAKPAPTASALKLALKVQAPQAVFIRGRGLNAEVGGEFAVTGNPSAPTVLGGLNLRRGSFNLAGHTLDFSKGTVSLEDATTIDPRIDFTASTSVASNTIEVNITGSPKAPAISVTSVPPLPQDEAMAMLLFGKPSSGLSPSEILMAAQAVQELTSGGSVGSGVFGRLRNALGLDQLSVGGASGAASGEQGLGGTSIQGGRYVAPGVYVGAEQGTTATSTRGVVEIEVFKHTKIQGAVGADSNDKIGAKMEWDY